MDHFSDRRTIRLRVNSQEVERTVEVRKLLADFLREDLGLTATGWGVSMVCAARARCYSMGIAYAHVSFSRCRPMAQRF
jgi:aerobic-type carbon monoxide dehydrogenase small subunit (CoxS/CutS family)